MIALFRPGRSALHRLPAGMKIVVLAVSTTALSFVPRDPWSTGLVGVAVVGCYALAGFIPRQLVRQLWGMRWIAAFMAVTQLLFLTPADAVQNTARVVSLVLLASLLALTTSAEDLLAALDRGLRPLTRLGVDTQRVSLTLSLAMTMVPVIVAFAARAREAQHARGARLGVRFVVPLLVMSLRHADDVGDALAARGMR